MIFCRKCGYEGLYTGKQCPNCSYDITLTEDELSDYRRELREATERGEYETVVENTRILADFGDTEAQREYGIMLERGRLVARDLDGAMEYFCRAAEKRDALSAFRYSRLISRISDEAGSFWLCYSALLGYPEAFLPAAEEYEKQGKNDIANYYYYRSVSCDEVDAIVALAEKYYNGRGIERSPEYAKWYMDKLTFPPFYAIKFALKLRAVTPKEPPAISLPDYEGLLRGLYAVSKRKGYTTATFHIAEMLAERGDKAAAVEVGLMYISGTGTEKNAEEAIRTLTRAAVSGSGEAYAILGGIYLEGSLTEKNHRLGISCLNKAAELGTPSAYERLGDYYTEKENPERNIALAYELYEKAARGGISSAKAKAADIHSRRTKYYESGKAAIRRDPSYAYKCLSAATAMGYIPAALELGNCYLYGAGVRADRKMAFYWYNEAADAGHLPACLPLGLCYGKGIGTAFDFGKAAELLRRAYDGGVEGAAEELIRLYEQKKKDAVAKLYSKGMRLVYQQKYTAAAEHLAMAARCGHPKAAYTLGTLYEFGRGVECSRERAHALYDQAAEGGFSDYDRRHKQTMLRMMKRIF